MLNAKTLGIFTMETALQTALQLRNGKSAWKLSGLDAGSSLSSVTHSSLQTHFHLVVTKLGRGRPCSAAAARLLPVLQPS